MTDFDQLNTNPGIFVFSLDTELGTGYFDRDEARRRIFSPDGSRERKSVDRILSLLQQRNIKGTWALVGHLIYAHCERCEICPLKDWQGRYASFEEAYGTSHPLWYGEDIVRTLAASMPGQEIAFHGYSHRIFDEAVMTREEARIEIQEWLRAGERFGLVPRSVVFPRDRPGYLDILHSHGLTSFRAETIRPLLLRNRWFGKYLKTIGHLAGIIQVPLHHTTVQYRDGLIALPDSEHLFDFNRDLELRLDHAGLKYLRIRRLVSAVNRAGQQGKILHLWAHPWEFRTEDDFDKLIMILDAVRKEMDAERMLSMGMADLAALLVHKNQASSNLQKPG